MNDLQAEIERDQRALEDLQYRAAKLADGLKIKRGVLLGQKEQQLLQLRRDLAALSPRGMTQFGLQARRESMQSRINALQLEIGNLKQAAVSA